MESCIDKIKEMKLINKILLMFFMLYLISAMFNVIYLLANMLKVVIGYYSVQTNVYMLIVFLVIQYYSIVNYFNESNSKSMFDILLYYIELIFFSSLSLSYVSYVSLGFADNTNEYEQAISIFAIPFLLTGHFMIFIVFLVANVIITIFRFLLNLKYKNDKPKLKKIRYTTFIISTILISETYLSDSLMVFIMLWLFLYLIQLKYVILDFIFDNFLEIEKVEVGE
ncbi:MAG: hypothetical protein R3Y13_01055 [bacterium]